MIMDDKDRTILEYLMEKGRDKIADISRNLDIPRITIYERMQNMISLGVIRGFTAIPDYSQIDLGAMAYVFLAFDPKGNIEQREMARMIGNFHQVYEVSIVAGEWDLLLKVRGKSIEEIGDFVLDKLRAVPGVERTETIAVFSSVK